MDIEVVSASFTGMDKDQVCAWIKVDNSDSFPFYVSMTNEDSSDCYKYIKSKIDSGEIIPKDYVIDVDSYAVNMRIRRNTLLNETDYLMNPDYPISDDTRNQIKIYRQSLRDITEQYGFPLNIVWPIKPDIVKS